MQKTKIGLSVGIVAAFAYLLGLAGGYIALILIAGYVLLKEEDNWLKYSVVKAIAVAAVFDVFIYILNIIPDVLDWIYSCISLGHGFFDYAAVTSVFSILTSALRIVKTIIFIILIFSALKQNTINVPIVDDLITKNNFFGGNPMARKPQAAPQYQNPGQAPFNGQPNQFQGQPQQPMQGQPQQAPFQGDPFQSQPQQNQFQQAPNQNQGSQNMQ